MRRKVTRAPGWFLCREGSHRLQDVTVGGVRWRVCTRRCRTRFVFFHEVLSTDNTAVSWFPWRTP